MPRLVVLRGPGTGTSFELAGIVSIGRSSSNDIQLRTKRISREHARVEQRGDIFFLIDLASSNGVAVNGQKVFEHILTAGDEVQIGNVLLVFEPEYGLQLDTGDNEPAVVYSEDASEVTATFQTGLFRPEPSDTEQMASYEALAEANRKLSALYEVSDAIYSELDLAELLRKLLDVVLRILGGDRSVILLYDGRTGALVPVAARARRGEADYESIVLKELAVSKTILDKVAREHQAVLTADATVDPRFDASDSISVQSIRSVMCVPLLTQNKCHGLMYVDTTRPALQFSQDDLRLLTTIARQAATAIGNARSYDSLQRETRELRQRIGERYVMVGGSKELKAVLDQVKKVASSDSTVLITGETGTGKELVARAIHEESDRSGGAFVTVNCAAVPETLLESELFGHERGAFTGAHKTKLGRFELADHGTIFLDEVGEVPLPVQSKLLRAVETKTLERVGGTRQLQADVRIIAATNRDLQKMVKSGAFREDLYYRLAVVPISVPPLRRRVSDIAELAESFVERYAQETGKRVAGIAEDAMAALCSYPWPGNVRELQNAIERAVILTDSDQVELDDLPADVAGRREDRSGELSSGRMKLADVVGQTERRLIVRALEKSGGKKVEAARLLGVSRPTLDKKIKDYGLDGG